MDDTPDLFTWAEEQQRDRAPETAPPSAPAPEAPVEEAEPVSGPVMLIDAFSQIFRCFFAIRQLNKRLNFSEQWVTDFVYQVVMLAKKEPRKKE